MAINPMRIISSPLFQFSDENGVPLAYGYIKVYAAGTTTTKTCYQDANGDAAWPVSGVDNVVTVTLDIKGSAVIYGTGSYKFKIYKSDGTSYKDIDYINMVEVSTFAQTLLDDTSATAARSTLGLGSASTLTASGYTGTLPALSLLQLDASSRIPAVDGRNITELSYSIPGLLNGMTLSCGSDTILGISAGICWDDASTSRTGLITLSTNWTKVSGTWVAGTGGGCGVTFSGSTWYHVFAIKDITNSLSDIFVSTSATAPTLPTGYTLKRRIGSFKTVAGLMLNFNQIGDNFYWTEAKEEASNKALAANTSASQSLAFVASGIDGIAMLSAVAAEGAVANLACSFLPSTYSDPTAVQVGTSGFYTYPLCQLGDGNSDAGTSLRANAQFSLPYFSNGPSVKCISYLASTVNIYTIGWIDTRGR